MSESIRVGPRRVRRPLAPITYLRRNASKTIPLTAVIVLAVMLVAGIIAMINSIPLSIRTIYGYSKEMLGVTPRGEADLTPKLLSIIRNESPVPLARVMVCRASGANVQSIVGKWPFAVIALGPEDMKFYLDRQLVTGIVGRMPTPGAAECLVSEPVARNLNLKMGDALLAPDKEDYYSPFEVKIVGIAQTARWLMLTDIDYHRMNHFPPIDLALAFAENPTDQSKLDEWAVNRFKGMRAQIFAYYQIEKSTNEMFQTLYQILNIVIGTLVVVITFMMGMLMNIYQSQRLVEFGLLQALGYTKQSILRRVMLESVIVIVAGWALGVLAAFGLLNLAKTKLMDPKAYAIDTLDQAAYLYAVPLPVAILVVALVTVVLRFRKFDPVGVVERRLV